MRQPYCRAAWGTLLLVLMCATLSLAQSADDALRREIEALKRGQQEIRNELQEIKRLLQQAQQPARRAEPEVSGMKFELGERPVKGVQTAQLTLLEFTDYQ